MPGSSLVRRFVILMLGVLLVTACGPGTSKITVTDALVPVPATADSASIYLKITNDGDRDDRLVKVTTPLAALTILHSTAIDPDGRATMTGVGSVKIPAGETVDLSPGGLHLMMMQPDAVSAGDEVDLSLTFEHAGTIEVTARVTDDIEEVLDGE